MRRRRTSGVLASFHVEPQADSRHQRSTEREESTSPDHLVRGRPDLDGAKWVASRDVVQPASRDPLHPFHVEPGGRVTRPTGDRQRTAKRAVSPHHLINVRRSLDGPTTTGAVTSHRSRDDVVLLRPFHVEPHVPQPTSLPSQTGRDEAPSKARTDREREAGSSTTTSVASTADRTNGLLWLGRNIRHRAGPRRQEDVVGDTGPGRNNVHRGSAAAGRVSGQARAAMREISFVRQGWTEFSRAPLPDGPRDRRAPAGSRSMSSAVDSPNRPSVVDRLGSRQAGASRQRVVTPLTMGDSRSLACAASDGAISRDARCADESGSFHVERAPAAPPPAHPPQCQAFARAVTGLAPSRRRRTVSGQRCSQTWRPLMFSGSTWNRRTDCFPDLGVTHGHLSSSEPRQALLAVDLTVHRFHVKRTASDSSPVPVDPVDAGGLPEPAEATSPLVKKHVGAVTRTATVLSQQPACGRT